MSAPPIRADHVALGARSAPIPKQRTLRAAPEGANRAAIARTRARWTRNLMVYFARVRMCRNYQECLDFLIS